MYKFKTNSPLDKLLDGGIENDVITNIYGPAGSGKSNIALMASIACEKNVVYIDTESSFSFERFEQMNGKDLNKVKILEVHTWEEQNLAIKNLEKILEKEDIGLIVVDSMVNLYRLELDNTNFQLINKQLAAQYSVLSSIARKRKIPVLITNQVYNDQDGIELTSRNIAKYWSKTLIELKKLEKENHRTVIIRKHRSQPENKKIEFEITKDGMKPVGKFSII